MKRGVLTKIYINCSTVFSKSFNQVQLPKINKVSETYIEL